jgi:hypothetical protein
MVRYQPIFKAKPAEYMAWGNAGPGVRAAASPVLELAPSADVNKYLAGVVKSTKKAISVADGATIDASALDQTVAAYGGMRIIPWLSGQLAAEGVPYRPVVPADASSLVLADAAAAAALHRRGVTVREGTVLTLPDPTRLAAALPGLLASLAVSNADLHLLLDFQYVSAVADVARAASIADVALAWVASLPAIGSVAVASGAFPTSISSFPVATATLLPRLDASLYSSLTIPPGLDVDYADYAVNHPATGPAVPRSPLPNLRYSSGTDWLIWREARALPGNESFFTVCRSVVAGGLFRGAGYSWGDAEIARASTGLGGAGRATEWRAYSTSHHIAEVVDRLATLRVP